MTTDSPLDDLVSDPSVQQTPWGQYDRDTVSQSRLNAIYSHARQLATILSVDKADIRRAILSTLPAEERQILKAHDQRTRKDTDHPPNMS
jgi:hypothetical protein